MTPDRVTLECTPRGWVWTVYAGDKELAGRTVQLDRHGATGTTRCDLFTQLADCGGLLAVAIDDASPLLICRELIGKG